MTSLKVSEARVKLYRLVNDASASHEPVLITGKRGNAVLISEDDWRAIQESVYRSLSPSQSFGFTISSNGG